MSFMYYSLTPPAQWKAGSVGTTPNDTPIYFDCADCGAHEPEIAGILSSDGTYTGLALLRGADIFVKPAMFCAPCFEKRIHPAPVRCTGYADGYIGGEQCELEQGHEGRCELRDVVDDETGQVLR